MTKVSQYPNILAAVNKMGKVKQNALNKKRFAEAEQMWLSMPADELEKLNEEIAVTEPLRKNCIVTSVAVVYYQIGVAFIVPVRDICWFYPRVIKNTVYYFFTTDRSHQIWMVDRTGDRHLIFEASTGPFVKKQPAVEALDVIREKLSPVRKGIIYGYAQDVDNWFASNPSAAAAKVDEASL